MRALALALPLLLGACAPKPQASPPQALAPDCAKDFESQQAAITAQPLTAAPPDPSEPHRYYSTAGGEASYVITKPASAAHPAIVFQRAAAGKVVTDGCAWGDKAAYEALKTYVEGLAAYRK